MRAQAKEFDNQFAEALRATCTTRRAATERHRERCRVRPTEGCQAIQATRKKIEDGITMPGKNPCGGRSRIAACRRP